MFSKLKFEPSTKDLFWEEKVKRTIESMETTKELKEMQTKKLQSLSTLK